MNEIWHFLREFESKEIVKRFVRSKYDYDLNTGKAFEINSAFIQGREYFSSSKRADVSVRPLLQYYGVVALSRGLILILDKSSRENNIIPSHGLKIKNWGEVCKTGRIEDVVLKSSKGTFSELIKVTNNKSYFRGKSSGVNWQVSFDIPNTEVEFAFKEVAFSLPDLEQSVNAWLGIEVPCRILNSLKKVDDKYELEIQGKYEKKIYDLIFPSTYFSQLEFIEADKKCIVKFNSNSTPSLTQKWVSSFQVIGDICVVPPFEDNFFLNDISKMYSSSFILGTISRYYPSTWNNISKGISNDSVLPFTINYMDFIQEKFPQIIMDFINSPYDFE